MHLKLFPDFFDRPDNISFTEQEPDEQIELLLRQHWVVNIPWMMLVLIGAFVPRLVASVFSYLALGSSFTIPAEIQIAFVVLWYMFLGAYAIESFLHWYFNIYIVTNKHLVDINFHNIMHRDKVEVRIEDVQSTKSIFTGIFGSIFHYGDVIIETAAEKQRIEFHKVPRPDFVADRIQDLQSGMEDSHGV